ncbi:MAG TPA: HEAT repeat domain-containing protein [Gammaproteobacteria bacterium]|nr:HEAT repeat domain-containing protein [Gammaproteobacteria bacterium]
MPLSPPRGPGEPPEAPDPATLRHWLEADNPARRRMAARHLAGTPEASPCLAARLQVEERPEVREALLAALICQDDGVAADALLGCLRSPEVSLRNGAVEALQQMPEAFAVHGPSLLADPDPQIRQRAVEVMRDLRHPGVPGWLLAVLPTETDPNVCVAVVDALAEVGDAGACPYLEALMERFPGEPVVALAAGEALHRLEGWE